jgi:hypothetical protein
MATLANANANAKHDRGLPRNMTAQETDEPPQAHDSDIGRAARPEHPPRVVNQFRLTSLRRREPCRRACRQYAAASKQNAAPGGSGAPLTRTRQDRFTDFNAAGAAKGSQVSRSRAGAGIRLAHQTVVRAGKTDGPVESRAVTAEGDMFALRTVLSVLVLEQLRAGRNAAAERSSALPGNALVRKRCTRNLR